MLRYRYYGDLFLEQAFLLAKGSYPSNHYNTIVIPVEKQPPPSLRGSEATKQSPGSQQIKIIEKQYEVNSQ